jgi:hypothetical protein
MHVAMELHINPGQLENEATPNTMIHAGGNIGVVFSFLSFFLSFLLLLARMLIWDCGCSGELYNDTAFNIWVDEGTTPAIPATLKLYNFLKGSQFGVVLLTGRPESQRAITTQNLLAVGFSNWTELILKYFTSHFHHPWFQYWNRCIIIFVNLGLFRHFETVTNIRTWIKSHKYWRML